MKTLKFRGDMPKQILDGYKTSTMRCFDEKYIKAWEDLEFINSDTGEVFGHGVSTEVFEKPIKDLGAEDFKGHETYSSPEEMIKIWQEYYTEKVTPETIVKIIRFKLV